VRVRTALFTAILTFAVLIASACGSRQSVSPQADGDQLIHDELPVIYRMAFFRYADDPIEMMLVTDADIRQAILSAIETSMQNPMSEEEQSNFIFQSMIRSLFLPPLEFVIEGVTYSFHGIDPVLTVFREGEPPGYYHISDHWRGWWADEDTH